MALLPRTIDFYLTYRMVKLLMTPYTKMEAYRAGLIDENGKILKKRSKMTSAEKDIFGYADRFIINLKRLLNKLPGPDILKSTAAVLFLMREDEDQETLTTFISEYVSENEHDQDGMADLMKKLNETDMASNVTGDQVQSNTPFVKTKKSDLMGVTVFHVRPETYMKVLRGKHPNATYKTVCHGDDVLNDIQMYAKSNPRKDIMVKVDGENVYTYLRRKSIF